jgi:hypothetical protein
MQAEYVTQQECKPEIGETSGILVEAKEMG